MLYRRPPGPYAAVPPLAPREAAQRLCSTGPRQPPGAPTQPQSAFGTGGVIRASHRGCDRRRLAPWAHPEPLLGLNLARHAFTQPECNAVCRPLVDMLGLGQPCINTSRPNTGGQNALTEAAFDAFRISTHKTSGLRLSSVDTTGTGSRSLLQTATSSSTFRLCLPFQYISNRWITVCATWAKPNKSSKAVSEHRSPYRRGVSDQPSPRFSSRRLNRSFCANRATLW